MKLFLLAIVSPVLGLRIMRTATKDDIQLESYSTPTVSVDLSPLDSATSTTPGPPRYSANDPETYSIQTVYEDSVTGGDFTLPTTEEDIDICAGITGQARVDLGCIGENSLPSS